MNVTLSPWPPLPDPCGVYSLPTIAREKGFIFVDLPNCPISFFAFPFSVGLMHEPEGLEGITELLCRLLIEGAGDKWEDDMSLVLENLGASWRHLVSDNYTWVSCSAPTENLGEVFKVVSGSIRSPRLNPAAVTQVRADQVARIRSGESTARVRSVQAHALYGPGRQAIPSNGTEISVLSIGEKDLRCHHELLVASEATPVLVGDLRQTKYVADMVEQHHSRIPVLLPRIQPRPRRLSGREIIVVDQPRSKQARITIAHHVPCTGQTPKMALTTAVHLLGGSGQSRLVQELRDRRTQVYSARAAIDMNRDSGLFTAYTQTHPSLAADVTEAILETIGRIRVSGVTAIELARSKTQLSGQAWLNMQTPQELGAWLTTLSMNGLDESYWMDQLAELSSVTVDQVNEAAAQFLSTEDLVIILEGDARILDRGLSESRIGRIRIV